MGDVLAGRRKQSILVVEDNVVNADLLKEMLSSRGYPTVAVHNATAAEAEIRREAPDLILLDVIMPGKTGYELCRELKEDSKTRLIPIVMITGLSAQEDRLKRPRSLPSALEAVHRRIGDGGFGAVHTGAERGSARPLHRRPL